MPQTHGDSPPGSTMHVSHSLTRHCVTDIFAISWGFNAHLRPMPLWFNPNDARIPFLPYQVTVRPRLSCCGTASDADLIPQQYNGRTIIL